MPRKWDRQGVTHTVHYLFFFRAHLLSPSWCFIISSEELWGFWTETGAAQYFFSYCILWQVSVIKNNNGWVSKSLSITLCPLNTADKGHGSCPAPSIHYILVERWEIPLSVALMWWLLLLEESMKSNGSSHSRRGGTLEGSIGISSVDHQEALKSKMTCCRCVIDVVSHTVKYIHILIIYSFLPENVQL